MSAHNTWLIFSKQRRISCLCGKLFDEILVNLVEIYNGTYGRDISINALLCCRLGNNNITAAGAEQLAEGLRCSQSLQYLGYEHTYFSNQYRPTVCIATGCHQPVCICIICIVKNNNSLYRIVLYFQPLHLRLLLFKFILFTTNIIIFGCVKETLTCLFVNLKFIFFIYSVYGETKLETKEQRHLLVLWKTAKLLCG